MMRDARLRAAGVGTLVPMLALATIAALACGGLQLGRGRRPEVLAQVGEQAFLDPLNTETPADMALKIQGILKKEAILLRKISQREKKHQHVQIDITAGQIGKMGPQGPKGYTGAQGFQGPQGDTGPPGIQGPRGIQGPNGVQGVVGVDGDPGLDGADGDMGLRGPSGPRGRRGREGTRGLEGPKGNNGPNGSPGHGGEFGNRGRAAYEGYPGPQGRVGPPGAPGTAGDPGEAGWRGATGLPGLPGSPGPRGDAGPDGKSGKSVCSSGNMNGQRLCCGSLEAAAFTKVSAYSAAARIDMSKCRFDEAPVIFTSMSVVNEGRRYLNSGSNIINTKPDELDPNAATVNVRSIVRPCPVEPTFDTENALCYAQRYPDLSRAFGNDANQLIAHFKTYGEREKRAFNCLCSGEPELEPVLKGPYSIDNAKCYAARYNDLQQAFGYDTTKLIKHWEEFGQKEGRTFNCAWQDPLMTYPSYEVCGGSSSSKWKGEGDTMSMAVDTTGCGWTKGAPPMYFTSMSDTTCGAELFTSTPRCTSRTIGYQSIYTPETKGFTVKAMAIPGQKLPAPEDAEKYDWQVKWFGVRPFRPKGTEGAGYPCTSPRLLKGSGDQGVFTDMGEVCCDTTGANGWSGAGADSIQKTIDVSQCKFEKISYLFTNVRGDGPVDQMIGSSAYSPTAKKDEYVVHLFTGGKYMYWKATQFNFKIQWCAFGR